MSTSHNPGSEIGLELFADNEVTARILDIISGAKRTMALVSPYVDRVNHVEQQLLLAQRRGVQATVVVRQEGNVIGGNNSKDALGWFREHGMQVLAVPNLHAKFYINEKEAVVTSMNLLRSSWSGSLEVGVSVSGEAHKRLAAYLADTVRELSVGVQQLTHATSRGSAAEIKSRATGGRPAKAQSSLSARRPPGRTRRDEPKIEGFFGAVDRLLKDLGLVPAGFCIRCRSRLDVGEVQAGNVLCARCYRQWVRHENSDYPEKYCTTCGMESRTSYSRPQCERCYRG